MTYKENNKSNKWPIIILVFTTLAVLTISIYCFISGWFIVHQNLFYIPIVISCIYYGKKGLVFSAILSFVYFYLVLYFTGNFAIISQALARVFVFVAIAGIVAFLSINRRCAKEKMQQAHAQLKSLIDSASQVSIIATDLSGKIVTFNSGAEKMLGYSAEEIINKTPVVIHLDSEVAERGRELTKELGYPVEGFEVFVAYAKNGQYEEREWTYIKKDGSHIIVNLVVTSVRNDAGQIIGFLGVANDITERRKVEEELRQSKLKFQTIFDSTRSAVMLLTPEKGFFEGNPATVEIFGCKDKSEFIRMTPADLSPEYQPDGKLSAVKAQEMIAIAMDKGSHYFEWTHKRVNGEEFFADVLLTRMKWEDRMILQATVRDITEHRKADETSNLLVAIVEGSDDAILSKDLSGHILSWNKAAERMYGYEAREILGKHILLLSPPEEKDVYDRIIEQIKRGEKVSHFETERVTKDGSRVWVSLSISPILDSRGAVNGASIITRDITERKKAEEELEAMNLDLQRKTELLEISNKELEAFSYSVSHDLRAPLRSIDGFSKAILEDYSDKLDEQGRNYLGRVCEACQQMAQLIEDMLMLSRISRSGMRREKIDLSALVKSIADEFMQNEPQRKVEFVIAPSVTVNGDGQLLNIMLHNLLGNAWKFTGKHPSARIEFGINKKEEAPVYFVTDDGAGFDMKYADKLFGAFQRLHTIEEFEGTGIGLAIVQRIVSRHCGKIWAQGKVEKGATIYFNLG